MNRIEEYFEKYGEYPKKAPNIIRIVDIERKADQLGVTLSGKKQDKWEQLLPFLSSQETSREQEFTGKSLSEQSSTIPELQSILAMKHTDVVEYQPGNCRSILEPILKTAPLGSGIQGTVYRSNGEVVKHIAGFYMGEKETDNFLYSVAFMRRINNIIAKTHIPNLLETYNVYKCQNADEGEFSIDIFQPYVEGDEYFKTYISRDIIKKSIAAQMFCTIALLFYYGLIHADPHKGNILLTKTNIRHIEYIFADEKINVPTYGTLAILIDYDDVCIFQNNGKVLCNIPPPKGITPTKINPRTAYARSLDILANDVGYPEISDIWKNQTSMFLTFDPKNYSEYKARIAAPHLFSIVKEYFKFPTTKGKKVQVSFY
jgi:hypothetical protein